MTAVIDNDLKAKTIDLVARDFKAKSWFGAMADLHAASAVEQIIAIRDYAAENGLTRVRLMSIPLPSSDVRYLAAVGINTTYSSGSTVQATSADTAAAVETLIGTKVNREVVYERETIVFG